MSNQVKFDPESKNRLSALVYIARYPDAPQIQESINSGFYITSSGSVRLIDAQNEILHYYPVLRGGLVLTGNYNSNNFRQLINHFTIATIPSYGRLLDLVNEAIKNDDPSILERFSTLTPTKESAQEVASAVRATTGSEVPYGSPSSQSGESFSRQGADIPRQQRITGNEEESFEETPEPAIRETEEPQTQEPDSAESTPTEEQEAPQQIRQQPQEQQQQEQTDGQQPSQPHHHQQTQPIEDGTGNEKPRGRFRDRINDQRKKLLSLLRRGGGGSGFNIPWVPKFLQQAARQLARGAMNLASNLGRAALQGLARGAASLLSRLGMQAALGAGRGLLMGAGATAAVVVGSTAFFIGAVVVFFVGLFAFTWWYDQLIGNAECNKPEGVMKIVKQADNIVRPKLEYGNGEQVDYVIQVTYELACRSRVLGTVEVTDTIPEGTTYVEGSAESGFFLSRSNSTGVYDDATRTVTWTFKDFPTDSPLYLYLSVKTDPEVKGDFWLSNQATVKYALSGMGSGNTSTGGVPPTADNCNGTYQLDNPLGNFGDPNCDFDKDKVFALLKQQDPVEVEYWFTVLIPKETKPPYNPNSYNPGSTSGRGAYGLFQMNPNNGRSQYDIGDVEWPLQISNAVNYNNYLTTLGRTWCYWEAAIERWPAICRQR